MADPKWTRCKSHYCLYPNSWTKQGRRLRVTTWCGNRDTNFWVISSTARFREVHSFKYRVFVNKSILFSRGNKETHFLEYYWQWSKKNNSIIIKKIKRNFKWYMYTIWSLLVFKIFDYPPLNLWQGSHSLENKIERFRHFSNKSLDFIIILVYTFHCDILYGVPKITNSWNTYFYNFFFYSVWRRSYHYLIRKLW